VAGDCVRGNESSISIKCGEFFYRLRKYQRLKKDSGPLFYKSQHCWGSQFLEPVPEPLVQEQIYLCENTAWLPTINKHWMFELC
jgi:hypothetical protein